VVVVVKAPSVVVTPPVVVVAPPVVTIVLKVESVERAVVVVAVTSSPLPLGLRNSGSLTGVRKTMMQTTATRHAPATATALRLCSMAASKANRKKPLSRKNRAMLTELRTFCSVSEFASLRTTPRDEHLPLVDTVLCRCYSLPKQAWCFRSQAPGNQGSLKGSR